MKFCMACCEYYPETEFLRTTNKGIKSRRCICKACVKKGFKFICRGCGKPNGGRGNYYDFCAECMPLSFSRINFCLFCGKVLHGKGQIYCLSCKPLADKEYKAVRLSILSAYENQYKSKGCVKCGYKKCLSALHFHHINRDKGRTISDISKNFIGNFHIRLQLSTFPTGG